MQPETWRWFGTTIIAVYAAIVATYREYATRRDKAPHVKVTLFTTMEVIYGPGRTESHIQVRVENHGHTDVTFEENAVSLQVKGVESFFLLWDGKITDVSLAA